MFGTVAGEVIASPFFRFGNDDMYFRMFESWNSYDGENRVYNDSPALGVRAMVCAAVSRWLLRYPDRSASGLRDCLADVAEMFPGISVPKGFEEWLSTGVGDPGFTFSEIVSAVEPAVLWSDSLGECRDAARLVAAELGAGVDAVKAADALAVACWTAGRGQGRDAVVEAVGDGFGTRPRGDALFRDEFMDRRTGVFGDCGDELAGVLSAVSLSLSSRDFEDAVRSSVALYGFSGDASKMVGLTAMTGMVSSFLYGMPRRIAQGAEIVTVTSGDAIKVMDTFERSVRQKREAAAKTVTVIETGGPDGRGRKVNSFKDLAEALNDDGTERVFVLKAGHEPAIEDYIRDHFGDGASIIGEDEEDAVYKGLQEQGRHPRRSVCEYSGDMLLSRRDLDRDAELAGRRILSSPVDVVTYRDKRLFVVHNVALLPQIRNTFGDFSDSQVVSPERAAYRIHLLEEEQSGFVTDPVTGATRRAEGYYVRADNGRRTDLSFSTWSKMSEEERGLYRFVEFGPGANFRFAPPAVTRMYADGDVLVPFNPSNTSLREDERRNAEAAMRRDAARARGVMAELKERFALVTDGEGNPKPYSQLSPEERKAVDSLVLVTDRSYTAYATDRRITLLKGGSVWGTVELDAETGRRISTEGEFRSGEYLEGAQSFISPFKGREYSPAEVLGDYLLDTGAGKEASDIDEARSERERELSGEEVRPPMNGDVLMEDLGRSTDPLIENTGGELASMMWIDRSCRLRLDGERESTRVERREAAKAAKEMQEKAAEERAARPSVYFLGIGGRGIYDVKDAIASNGIDVVVNAGYTPTSKMFGGKTTKYLEKALEELDGPDGTGVSYCDMSESFGQKVEDYLNEVGQVDFLKARDTEVFRKGIARIGKAREHGWTLMFIGRHADPLNDNLFGLLGRYLSQNGWDCRYVMADGRCMSHETLEKKMVTEFSGSFTPKGIEDAYLAYNRMVGWRPALEAQMKEMGRKYRNERQQKIDEARAYGAGRWKTGR